MAEPYVNPQNHKIQINKIDVLLEDDGMISVHLVMFRSSTYSTLLPPVLFADQLADHWPLYQLLQCLLCVMVIALKLCV